MQELRIVLIVVGVLAIAGLLVHGLWTNKREQNGRFSDKPLSKLADEPLSESETVSKKSSAAEETTSVNDDFDVVKVTQKSDKKEPSFSSFDDDIGDPLLETAQNDKFSKEHTEEVKPSVTVYPEELPTITISSDAYSKHENESSSAFMTKEPNVDVSEQVEAVPSVTTTFNEPEVEPVPMTVVGLEKSEPELVEPKKVEAQPAEPEMEVLVLHVQAPPKQVYVGTELFDSMQQNGLHFGPMDIYHRYADLSGTGKVLFSVANMLKPGTLSHDDPETFTTEGISFFMTLPSYGDPEQNFKIMLTTAQMIADDLGGNVLDDKRALMTPGRISAFKRQIQDFVHRQKAREASTI
ncbi:cell division protein ZipA [Vibrio sp. UCD-FRSSP16_10]|uniref:cell division protein ZipA n=1 Tax=unclassified Vibrio TaxID=2614977 RepID=UPI0007FE3C33|nr:MULTISPECIES: cell division protein ZipA [unclassified Vibrio]OBT08622.1 cell division protein ZipA [Vibrio sp. UCD-FRSSP16_30]OBT18152.1 cell division protein ZipA [Vibrio sp. UCD-FRSSP16_10]